MLYHAEIYFKPNFIQDALTLAKSVKKLSDHEEKHLASTDKKHNYTREELFLCWRKILNGEGFLFEVEEKFGEVTKAVYRVSLNENKDISIVIRKGVIITAWINSKEDNHYTLDCSKYERA